MQNDSVATAFSFLKGGGEMGALTRAFDWTKTPVGEPGSWRQSLRTTLNLVLSSRFPMALWWGSELIQFYNDGFRASLGTNGKHPAALGQSARTTWAEIWLLIQPFTDALLAGGESSWMEDQLVPIFRNGQVENVYWTLGFSPVHDEAGEVAGVLLICQETTRKVVHSQESEERLNFALESAQIGTWEVDPVNDRVRWDDRCARIFGLSVGDDTSPEQTLPFVHPDDRTSIHEAMQWALNPQSGGAYDVTYRTLVQENQQWRWVRCIGQSYFNLQGQAYRFAGIAQDITQDRQAQNEQQKLLSLVGTSGDYMAVLSLEGQLEYMNPAGRQLIGLAADTDVTPFSVADLYTPEGLTKIRTEVEPALFREGRWSGTTYLQHFKSRALIPVRLNAVLMKDPISGQPIARGITIHDLRPELAARKALEESKEQFRNLVLNTPTGTAVFTGPDLRLELINEAMLKLWNKDASVMGKPFGEAMPELVDQSFPELIRQVYATGQPYRSQEGKAEVIVDGKRQTFWFNFAITPLYNAEGAIYGVINTAIDITEQVLSHQRVAAEQKRFRTLLETIANMTWTHTPQGEVNYYNERWYSYTGLTREQTGTNSWESVVHPDDLPHMTAALRHSLETGDTFRVENRYRRADGQYRWHLNRALPLYHEDGAIALWVGTATDIHEQKQLAAELEQQVQARTQQLQETIQDLRRSNSDLQQFAYVASHDLQEPLRKVQAFGDMLKGQYGTQLGAGMDYLNRMLAAAGRMSVLIKDLLAFSRISTQQESTQLVALNAVVNQVLSDLEMVIAETDAVIEVDPLPTLPGDAVQLGQLFQNLISNALKFRRTDENGVPVGPRIQIWTQRVAAADLPPDLKPARLAPAYDLVAVSDNGIGFDDKYVDRIFQVFQRLHAKQQYAGTGIGLAISEKVVSNHGGAITAVSQPGQGATFKIYLPVSA